MTAATFQDFNQNIRDRIKSKKEKKQSRFSAQVTDCVVYVAGTIFECSDYAGAQIHRYYCTRG